MVWSVALCDDLTVVSGDSRGKTCFWSGRNGTLADAYQTHAADVLAVCLGEEGEVAYSAGVDPCIFHFQVRQGMVAMCFTTCSLLCVVPYLLMF